MLNYYQLRGPTTLKEGPIQKIVSNNFFCHNYLVTAETKKIMNFFSSKNSKWPPFSRWRTIICHFIANFRTTFRRIEQLF